MKILTESVHIAKYIEKRNDFVKATHRKDNGILKGKYMGSNKYSR